MTQVLGLLNATKLALKKSWVCNSVRYVFHKNIINSSFSNLPSCVAIHPKIQEALEKKAPLVALESAIITHGMQYPLNFQTALDVENFIEREGALPATIGVIDGKVHVGLTEDQIQFLSTCNKNCYKVSRRDFPYVLAKGFHGGTTVAGTMYVCSLVGIPLFVTGGLGGVHRGGETSMDVSADLTELGRTPITVVSAGVKSILDVGRTLEYLETQGVCVATLGDSTAFPDFFTRDSGFQSPCRAENCEEAARMMLARREMRLESGMLLAVPIPVSQEADGYAIKQAIDQALKESEAEAITGRDVTPFVLRRVAEVTEGKSVLANMDLIRNNAKQGARIAVEYSKISQQHNRKSSLATEESDGKPQPVVIGGSIVDMTVKVEEPKIEFTGRTHRGRLTQSFGGVGRNVADALTRLGLSPLFLSAVGQDNHASALLANNAQLNLRGILRDPKAQTATYSVLLDCKGEALFGVGDMSIHDAIGPQWIQKFERDIERAPLVVVDGNITLETMESVFKICRRKNIPVWYEPTDAKKASNPWTLDDAVVSFASPNVNEFRGIINYLHGEDLKVEVPGDCELHSLRQILSLCRAWLSFLKGLMITFGRKGFMIVRWCYIGEEDSPLLGEDNKETKVGNKELVGLYFNPQTTVFVSSVSGAGDCLASGFIAGMLQQRSVSECAGIGFSCASLSLQDSEAVPKSLNPDPLASAIKLPYTLIQL